MFQENRYSAALIVRSMQNIIVEATTPVELHRRKRQPLEPSVPAESKTEQFEGDSNVENEQPPDKSSVLMQTIKIGDTDQPKLPCAKN